MTIEHPSFTLAKALSEPWRTHFPKTPAEARTFNPHYDIYALASRVLAVAVTRVECSWCAYVDAVPGMNHKLEYLDVVQHGDKLPENVARTLFPQFNDIPYAH